MSYFPPAPKSSMDMDRVMQYVQRNAQTFYQQLTLRGVSLTSLTTTGNVQVGGTLFVTGNTTLSTLGTSGAVTLGSTLAITGTTSVAGEPAYYYKESVVIAADANFTKGDYPGLRAIEIEMVGAGGSGGGAILTGAGQGAVGSGGGGGAYVRSWVLAADLDTTEAVTVGVGQSGGAAGNNNGADGTDSVFDTISGEIRADSGKAGSGSGAAAASGTTAGGAGGTVAGSTVAGSNGLAIPGGDGWNGGWRNTGADIWAFAQGGGSILSAPGRIGNSNLGSAGIDGKLYGGGGGGGYNYPSQAAGKAGGAGANGLVVVHIYV